MKTEERLELYKKAISTFGAMPQVFMLYEKTKKLANVIVKYMRGRYNEDEEINELADVSIMIEQMASMLNYDKFEKEKERKLLRLEERFEKEKAEKE